MMAQSLSDWVFEHLVCPVDRQKLKRRAGSLACADGHEYPITDGIPVLLVKHLDPTHPYCAETLRSLKHPHTDSTPAVADGTEHVDPFVQDEIVKTNGNLYRHLRGRLTRYPIPSFRFGPGNGRFLLDVGSNWGRWTFSASRAGFRAIGLDPWIEAARAGQRVARQLGLDVPFVVGDARSLPFSQGSFDATFSYSVLQHFDKEVARHAIGEMSRVTRLGGRVITQMPNLFGIRQGFNHLRQHLAGDDNVFRVRYWRPAELLDTFSELVGSARLEVDGFFSLNPQAADLDLLPRHYAWLVLASELLRAGAARLPALRAVADSLYIDCVNLRTVCSEFASSHGEGS